MCHASERQRMAAHAACGASRIRSSDASSRYAGDRQAISANTSHAITKWGMRACQCGSPNVAAILAKSALVPPSSRLIAVELIVATLPCTTTAAASSQSLPSTFRSGAARSSTSRAIRP